MNYKIFFAFILAGLSMQICARQISIQFTDKTVEYDSKVLKKCFSDSSGSGPRYPDTIKMSIDSKEFAFLLKLTQKDDSEIFSFFDSLDAQSLKVIYFFAQMIYADKIIELLTFKMLENPDLQKLIKVPNETIYEFILGRFFTEWTTVFNIPGNLAHRHLNRFVDTKQYKNEFFKTQRISSLQDSICALLVLIDFYQETLKKPLPINTDHLKKVFNAQPYDIQQILINKNLVIVS